jgi:hypothetical protein
MDEKATLNIGGTDYTLSFSNRAFMRGMFLLKKQGYDLGWGDLLKCLEMKDLTVEEMQGEPFLFAALTFIGICGEKGQKIEFDDVLEDMTFLRMPLYIAALEGSVGPALDAGEPPVELEGGGDGPDPLAESGSETDGASPDTTSDSAPVPNPAMSMTSSGTSRPDSSSGSGTAGSKKSRRTRSR